MKHYALMSVFASGPERIPFSPPCVAISMFFYLLLGLALATEQRGYGLVVFQIVLEISLLSLVAYLALKWKALLSRWPQTCSALIGVNLVISAVSIPVFNWLADNTSSETNIENKLLYATMFLVFWNLAVLSQIFKRAFEINTTMAAMIAFNYFLVYQFTVVWFY